jgi:DNA mismatch endonuclease (patch repair protein)
MARTGPRNTKPELSLRSELHRRGLRYRVDFAPLKGVRRRADVVFPGRRVAVFVDGCFWHVCPEHSSWPKNNAGWWREKLQENQRRDRDTDRKLQDAGWITVRVWEHEDPVEAAERIVRVLPDDNRNI